ncbi:MAG: esterase/lipase family protein [Thermomicrobiales bacterium]
MRIPTTIARYGRPLVTLVFVMQMTVFGLVASPVTAADLPFAGDDTFQIGPTTVSDPTTVSITVDRAYGPLADDAGHVQADLIGKSVATDTAFEVAPSDGTAPAFSVAINGFPVQGAWQPIGSESRVYRLTLPTAQLLFPRPGDGDTALVPRVNTLTLTGASASLDWLRLVVPGTPPALLMAGADFSCGTPGPSDPVETWNDWGRWLTADGIPNRAPARDGRLAIAEQLPALDNGYAFLQRAYGPNRPGLSPRITLVGYSMGGLVSRLWAFQHPGVVMQLVELASPDAGTDAAMNFFAIFLSRCASGALHDLSPFYVADFNSQVDLSHYWDPDPATMHITTMAAVPATGEPTDGLVPEMSADALPYATHLTWTPDALMRPVSLHLALPHAEEVYTNLRDAARFASPLPDARTGQ